MNATNENCWSCDEPVEQNAQFCPFCGIENPTKTPHEFSEANRTNVSTESSRAIAEQPEDDRAQTDRFVPTELASLRIETRYRDAYRVAASLVFVGNALKVLGVIAGVIGVIAAAGLAEDFEEVGVAFGLTLGVLVFLSCTVLGVIISALGQQLRATLDQAVHSSPFLNNPQRLKAMGIKTGN